MIALRGHSAIGWDFDGTLFGHHNSRRMIRFIAKNPALRHVIVTFRSHGSQREVFPLLRADHPTVPVETLFERVVSIPDRLFFRAQRDRYERIMGRRLGPLTPHERLYIEWKGEACRDHGLTVLVDDMTEDVLPGCEMHGILHIHPDDL